MIKEKLKRSAALMLSAAMVLSLAPPLTGGIKAYADEDDDWVYWAGDIDSHFYVDSSDKDYGLFKSAVPITEEASCGTDQDDSWNPKEISGYEETDFRLVDRYNASFLKPIIGYNEGEPIYATQEDTLGAIIRSSDNTVMAAKGVYSETFYDEVYLVIQGRQQGKNDKIDTESDAEYYYRIKINTVRGASTKYIKVILDETKGFDVSKCEIWLEGRLNSTVASSLGLSGMGNTFWATKAISHDHKSEGKTYLRYRDSDGNEYHAHFCEVGLDLATGTIGCPFYMATLYDIGGHTTKYVDLNDLDDETKNVLIGQGYSNCHFRQCTVCNGIYPYTEAPTAYDHEYKYSHTNDEHWEVCKDCNYEKTSSREAHSPSDNYKADDDYHWKTCEVCYDENNEDNVELDKDEHDWDENLVCKICRYDLNQKHNFTDEPNHAMVEPTCTKVGYKAYWKCTDEDCEVKKYEELGVQIKFSEMSEIEIPMIDHTEDATYSYNSSTHWHTCTVCGAKITTSEAAHIFDNRNVCTVCGYKRSSSSSNVNTGWIKDSKGWKYRNSDGIIAQGTTVTDSDGNKVEKVLWQKAGNGYYAFGSDGYLKTGWIYDKLEDKWYYCDENMGKLYGWFNESQDGYWYYLSPSTGEAMTGWQSINGKDYYFAAEPSAPTYSFDASTGFWIYSNIEGNRPFGSMYANTVTPDNYAVDASGAWIK